MKTKILMKCGSSECLPHIHLELLFSFRILLASADDALRFYNMAKNITQIVQGREDAMNILNRNFLGDGSTKEIKNSLARFNILAASLQILFVLLASISVTSSLAVATFADELKERNQLKIFAYTAALSSTLISAFSLNRKASDARTAWRMLRVALMKHNEGPDRLSVDELIDRYAEAEDTIGHVVFNPPQQESHTLKVENEKLRQQLRDLERVDRASKELVIRPNQLGDLAYEQQRHFEVDPPEKVKWSIEPKGVGRFTSVGEQEVDYKAPEKSKGFTGVKITAESVNNPERKGSADVKFSG